MFFWTIPPSAIGLVRLLKHKLLIYRCFGILNWDKKYCNIEKTIHLTFKNTLIGQPLVFSFLANISISRHESPGQTSYKNLNIKD